jgi:hypothetical protein
MVSSIAAHTFYKAKLQIQDSEVSELRSGCRDWKRRTRRFVSSRRTNDREEHSNSAANSPWCKYDSYQGMPLGIP